MMEEQVVQEQETKAQVEQEKKDWGYGTGLMVGILYAIVSWVLTAGLQWGISNVVPDADNSVAPMIVSSIVSFLTFVGYVLLIIYAFSKGQKRFGWGVLTVTFAGIALLIIGFVVIVFVLNLT
jgi:hypothetical protein